MRKIIIPILIIALLSLTSCLNDNKLEATPNSGWVEVDGDTFSKTVNFDEAVQIPIKLNSATNTNGIGVTYKVQLIDGSIDNQSVLGNKTMQIEAGNDIGMIEFMPELSSYYYTLKFTLIRTDDAEFKVGLPDGSQPVNFTVAVTNFKDYDGTVMAFGQAAPAYVTKASRKDATHFIVESLWGPDFVAWAANNPAYLDGFYNAGELIVDPTDNSLTVTGDYVATTGSTGTYTPATGVLDYSFVQANLFGTGFTVNTTLTPQ